MILQRKKLMTLWKRQGRRVHQVKIVCLTKSTKCAIGWDISSTFSYEQPGEKRSFLKDGAMLKEYIFRKRKMLQVSHSSAQYPPWMWVVKYLSVYWQEEPWITYKQTNSSMKKCKKLDYRVSQDVLSMCQRFGMLSKKPRKIKLTYQ